MTISTENNKKVHEANGVQDTFAYDFKIFAEADLKVYEDAILTTKSYTVSGVGDAGGGDVVFTGAVPADEVLVTLIRESDYTQETDYTAYGPFPAETHEETVDKVVILVQQLKEFVDRCIKVPNWNETINIDIEMEVSDDEASTVLGYDATGALKLIDSDTLDFVNDFDLSGNAILADNNDNIISGRNAADDAYLPMMKLNTDDEIELTPILDIVGGFKTTGAYKALLPTVGVAADSVVMTGDSSTIIWMYLNVAPPGWKVLATGADTVLAVSGGSEAYDVNGGTAGGDFDISITNMPVHDHDITIHANDGGNDVPRRGADVGGTGSTEETGGGDGKYRPTGSVGKLFQLNTA